MDKNDTYEVIFLFLNTLKNLSANRSVRAQNMSNLNVPGHRKDLNTNFTSGFLHQVNQYDTRVCQKRFMTERMGFQINKDNLILQV